MRTINKTFGGREEFLVQLQHNIEDVLNGDSTATLEYTKRINEMRHFLQTQTSIITEYDEQLVRRLIEKITVYDDKLIFEFKSGMTIELKK